MIQKHRKLIRGLERSNFIKGLLDYDDDFPKKSELRQKVKEEIIELTERYTNCILLTVDNWTMEELREFLEK